MATLERSQAQLILTIRPSADNTNNPVFVFGGNTTTASAEAIRTNPSGQNELSDTFTVQNLYSSATLTNVFRSLSPLSSLPADDPDRLTEGDSAPTIAIGANALSISHIAFDSQPSLGDPDPGIRASHFHFYTAGNAVSWRGAGVLTNFNTSQFNPGTYQSSSHPNFSSHALRLTVRNAAIPEPEEYALVFGLFAFGFVLCRHRRHFQKKQRPAQVLTTS